MFSRLYMLKCVFIENCTKVGFGIFAGMEHLWQQRILLDKN